MIFHPIIPVFLCLACWLAVAGGLVYCLIKKPKRNVKNFRRISIIAALILLMMRPAVLGEQSNTIERKLNVFFVADFTGSMAARDGSGETYRYEQVKDDIVYIANQFRGARYCLISLVQVPLVSSPLSSDLDTLENGLKVLTPPETYYSKSTPLTDLLDFSATKIARYAQANPDYQNIVFFMSDGEDTDEDITTIPSELTAIANDGMVLGYGTSEGATVERIDRSGLTGNPIRTTNADGLFEAHISKRNDENLNHIATSLNVSYVPRTTISLNESDFKKIADKAESIESDKSTQAYHEGYWIVALVLAALLAWEFHYVLIELMRERKNKK